MRILVTGANGFIGRNLMCRLAEGGYTDVVGIGREADDAALVAAAKSADFVFHLAGINRPQSDAEFASGNVGVSERLVQALTEAGHKAPVVFASSTQAERDNPYGRSKRAAEDVLRGYGDATGARVHLFRLTNVFGKWSRPNYNSAVATFCHQVANGKPLTIHDASAPLRLVYVDDVAEAFLALLAAPACGTPGSSVTIGEAHPIYDTTVGEVARLIESFPASRSSLVTPPVGRGLVRALHATYLSFLPPASFAYDVPAHTDPRGEFVEMLKTADSGQFSYFTAYPGITRGEHYHHSKTEKFLVIRGTARYRFRNIVTDETYEIVSRGGEGRIVETVPGWTHNITNIGADELIVMLWANENFDRSRPDTFARKVDP